MGALLILPVCLLAGILLRRSGRMPEGGHVPLTVFVVNVALPALTLVQLHGAPLGAEILWPVAMPWLIFGLAFVPFRLAGRALGLPRETTGALILCGGLANTAFVGLPMVLAFHGPAFVPVAVMADQLGTFLVLSTLGTVVAAAHAGEAAGGLARSVTAVARRLLAFPPFLATAAAFALMPVAFPSWLSDGLHALGAAVVPAALCAVGLQLRAAECRAVAMPLVLGLAFKLLLAPAVLLAVVSLAGAGGEAVRVGLLQAAMGPQIGAAVIAAQYGLDRRLVSAMVAVGIPLSFVTAPAWHWVLAHAVP